MPIPPRLVLASLVALAAAGCDSGVAADPTTVTVGARTTLEATPDGWRATSPEAGEVRVSDGRSGILDVHFEPPSLSARGELRASVGRVQLRSRRTSNGVRRVSFVDVTRRGLRVEGVLDGAVVSSVAVDTTTTDAPGGETTNDPTSVHYRRVCSYGSCVDVVEYDYDRVASGTDGTTEWVGPGGQVGVEVDRVRFVMESVGPVPTGVRISGFTDLVVRPAPGERRGSAPLP